MRKRILRIIHSAIPGISFSFLVVGAILFHVEAKTGGNFLTAGVILILIRIVGQIILRKLE